MWLRNYDDGENSSETLWTARLSFTYPWAAKPNPAMRVAKVPVPFPRVSLEPSTGRGLALTYSLRR
jgi:hypothetical protein